MPVTSIKSKSVVGEKSLGLKLAAGYLVLISGLALLLPWLPLPFRPETLDLTNSYQAPFFLDNQALTTNHYLGTDQLGRDVLVNLLYGFRTGFFIAVPVMALALLLGTFAGSVAGYFGNRQWQVSRAALLVFVIWLFAVIFYVFYLPGRFSENPFSVIGQKLLWFFGLSLIALALGKLLKTLGILTKNLPLPVDELVLKTTEVLTSVPRLVLILTFSAVAAPGIGNVILLLSLTYWTGPARLVRAEVLKIKELPYIEAAKVSGLTNLQIIIRHILPNAAAPLGVAFSFGLSSLLGLEATLSFLGIGLPPEIPSWGRMLAASRLNPEAWWLVAFPAVLLCVTILAIQTCGNYYQRKLQKR